jgi:hypothetical protein
MVGTICPTVCGSKDYLMGKGPALLFLLCSVLGAVVLGLLFGGAGILLNGLFLVKPYMLSILLGSAVVFTLAEFGDRRAGFRWRPPSLKRQVSASTLVYLGPNVTSALWGLELGVGFLTFVNSWLLIVLAMWTLAIGSIVSAAVCFGAFGLIRGLQPLLSLHFDDHDSWGDFTLAIRQRLTGAFDFAALLTMTTVIILLAFGLS